MHQGRGATVALQMLPDFTAWYLEAVRAALAEDGVWGPYPLRIVETAPPLRPQKDKAGGSEQRGKSPRTPRTTNFGAARVLRARLVDEVIELLVAREELRAAEIA